MWYDSPRYARKWLFEVLQRGFRPANAVYEETRSLDNAFRPNVMAV